MNWPDAVPTAFPDALAHSIAILEELNGDLELAMVAVVVMMGSGLYTADYCRRLGWLLESKGDC